MNPTGSQPQPPQNQYPQAQHPQGQQQAYRQPHSVQTSPQPVKEKRLDTRGVTGKWLVETAALVVLAFVIAMGVRHFIIEPYRIPTESMLPTIQAEDHILIYRLGTHLGNTPNNLDVIVFEDPIGMFPSLVKRVVATEGQVVDFTPEGYVTIDGVLINEPYIVEGSRTAPLHPESNLGAPLQYPFTVPEGYVFVMGDNRERSSDSRAFGPVSVNKVKGVAFFTYWPLGHFATLE
ncbi:MAG: signal peptidase I [Coriobacteriia bacterium]|nr:signal peptidase I [Coriobacteriia bacterium]